MFMKLCAMKDIPPGEMKKFDLKEEEILVVNLSGQFYCLEARCSHAGAPLYEGLLEDTVLTCPWHYSQFDIEDGSVLRGRLRNRCESTGQKLRTARSSWRRRGLMVEKFNMKN